MHESPDLLEKTFPHRGFPSDLIMETAEWIEECTRKVATLARKEMNGMGEARDNR